MRFIPVVALLSLTAPVAAQQLDGAFTLRSVQEADRVNINFQYADGHSNWGRTFDRSELSNVSRNGERITFALRREAGTFSFEGKGTLERAAGWYGFVPNADFQRAMEKLRFREIDSKDLFVFGIEGLTVESTRQLQRLISDTLDTDGLVRLINHGAGVKYVQAMTDAGFKSLRAEDYRRARDHGVSAEYAREMNDLMGTKLSLEELVRTRDHGVTPDYVRAMRDAGFKLSHEELVRTRDHGVTPDYVRAMRDAGFKLSNEELVRSRDRGVTVDFVKRMSQLGYDGLPIADYVRMRDHGVTPDFVEEMRDAGYGKLTASELVRLRDHGVTPTYVRRVKEMLKDSPSVEQIIRMRRSGFPAK